MDRRVRASRSDGSDGSDYDYARGEGLDSDGEEDPADVVEIDVLDFDRGPAAVALPCEQEGERPLLIRCSAR